MKRRKRIAVRPGAPDLRVEGRQSRLADNAEAIERWHAKLFRASRELQKLVAQRRRLLNPPDRKLKYRGETIIGSGGGAVDGWADDQGEIVL